MAGSEHHRWRDRHLVLAREHVPELEARAAVHELSGGLPPAAAEARAHEDYIRSHMTRAAAHHLAGIRSQHAVGNDVEARNHALYYNVLARTLGFDPNGQPPDEIARLAKDAGQTRLHPFVPHGADAVVLEHLRRKAMEKSEERSDDEVPIVGVESERGVDMSHLLPLEKREAGERLIVREEGDQPRTAHLVREHGGRRVVLGTWGAGDAAPAEADLALRLRAARDVAGGMAGLRRLADRIDDLRKAEPLEKARTYGDPGGFPGAVRIPSGDHPTRPAYDAEYHQAVEGRYGKATQTSVPVADVATTNQPVNADRMALYQKMLRAGDRVPPIVVARQGKRLAVLDGNHRVAAARAAGVGELPALLVRG